MWYQINPIFNTMYQFIGEIKSTLYKEERPKYILLIDATPAEEKKLQDVSIGLQYRASFYKVEGNLFYSNASGLEQPLAQSLKRTLGHTNFLLAELQNFQFY
jgi:hypothetical protein